LKRGRQTVKDEIIMTEEEKTKLRAFKILRKRNWRLDNIANALSISILKAFVWDRVTK